MEEGLLATSCRAFANFDIEAVMPVFVFAEQIVQLLEVRAVGVEIAEAARCSAHVLRQQIVVRPARGVDGTPLPT